MIEINNCKMKFNMLKTVRMPTISFNSCIRSHDAAVQSLHNRINGSNSGFPKNIYFSC